MKKIKSIFILTLFIFGLSSCSNEDSLNVSDQNNNNLLKTFKVKKDVNGAYSINFDVEDNTKIDKVFDENQNLSKFYLYSTENQISKQLSENLLIDNNNLKVSFIETNTDKVRNISIEDDNITLAKKSNDVKLSAYEISGNEDGNYDLNFSVKDNVAVSFVYNENSNTYEVHLEEGNADQTSFSRVLEKRTEGLLKLDFVTHVANENAKSSSLVLIRKPIIIIDEGED